MVQAIQQPQEEFPGHALPAAHEAGEELASKMEKLNLAFPVLPPLTPKTPVIGPLPKPAALTGFSQVEAKGLHSHLDSESKTDFDDPFEPEAEVKPFFQNRTHLTLLVSGGFPSLRRPPSSAASLALPIFHSLALPTSSLPLSFCLSLLLPNPAVSSFRHQPTT